MKLHAVSAGVGTLVHSFQNLAWQNATSRAVTVLVGTKLCLGIVYRSTTDDVAEFSPLTQLLLVEILKLGVSFAWWTRERQNTSPGDHPGREGSRSGSPVNSQPTYLRLSLPPIPTLIPLAGIISLNCAVGFAGVEAQRFAVPGAIHMFSLFTPLVCVLLLQLLFRRHYSASTWNGLLFQLAGLALIQCGTDINHMKLTSTLLLVGRVYLQAVLLSWMDLVFKWADHPLSALNLILWGSSSLLYLVAYVFIHSESLWTFNFSVYGFIVAMITAVEVVAMTFVLKHGDALTVGATSYSVSSILAFFSVLFGHANYKLLILLGICIAAYGLGIFVVERISADQEEQPKEMDVQSEESPIKAAIALGIGSIAVIIATVAISSQGTGVGLQSPRPTPWFDFTALPPTQSKAWCPRKPLPKLSGRKETKKRARVTSAFDNILLIVFFSHPRYDVNLDYHLEMYQDYFPNILYVGPQTREDAGHKGVYDVLVDGFKSDEDLSGDWFKMAGRMAHHMLFTAMKQNPCYDGYLWAPFDTFLNVPRLIQFKQDTIWWHSPFQDIITYVDNPALTNISHHAPPGTIQPGPAKDLIAKFKHWGKDWWWGEPNVGLKACMPAFETVSAKRRAQLAQLTDGELRMVGGSADTLYLPGYLREAFLETMDPFLDTDCFLEIAVPTAVHLIRPPSQKISFVDHWWIWEEPLNATFVRNQWADGYEVDTFHKYQFGKKDEQGHFQEAGDGLASPFRITSHYAPSDTEGGQHIISHITHLVDSYFIWVGGTVERLDSLQAPPQAGGSLLADNEVNQQDGVLESRSVELLVAQAMQTGSLAKDFSCAMPGTQATTPALGVPIFRSRDSDESLALSQRLARRFKKQIFLSIDIPVLMKTSGQTSHFMSQAEKHLLITLKSFEAQ
ncbi:unnamed protein product [Rhizoctonia solani]|uniref:Uncharacterized protein n=1 Tax=Rhizoctonia solani TaxID=456999 RepID=A0A8H3CBX0_9AGAM|nr:unnamed protein product [Rhizoctonia solani]